MLLFLKQISEFKVLNEGFNCFFLREKLEMKKGFKSITFHLVTQKKLSISSTTNNQIQIKMRKNIPNHFCATF
jgi:hypothetical protein